MRTKKLLFISITCIIIIIGTIMFLKNNIIFDDTEVFLLNSTSKISYENGYIEVTDFKLEDDIVKISLRSPLGNPSDWKETYLVANATEYPLKTNVFTSVDGQNSLNSITCIGEMDIEDFSKQSNSIHLMTPYGEIEVDYVKKRKLYY
ncbi:hypothetical protein [Schinkia azotoformans]|uniref:hypothetical protein n=1 Tax=Schinkia azotoformans TaxID=1454 RepID=UPI002DB5AF98|nr:hypothetical protein [Schinkia azotoformans]MEC1716256.1 hypothetical protein [Schinkia azotoformans]MEC1741633.1 hypothetical protein [Schinkia azotoformans]MEC1745655.1 hypothetical protein [Schinkia azotoformans]MEC1758975.1 hypothetical protein [Schinkia azotoformans]MEC1766853.1 hypothetical protein [Schinkia azotoformans]